MSANWAAATPGRGRVAAIVVVSAIGVYALLLVGRALPALAAASLGPEKAAVYGSIALILAGVGGSFLAARRFFIFRYPRTVGNGLRACGLSAVLALVANSDFMWLLTLVSVGLSLGWLSVSLLAGLRSVLGARVGWGLGMGVGLAYAFCQLPILASAEPRAQVILAALAVIVGALASPWLDPELAVEVPLAAPDETPGVWPWLLIFFALVALDRAIFSVLDLRASTAPLPREPTLAFAFAALHLAVALGAGWACDRGWRDTVVVLAVIWLVLAGLGLGEKGLPETGVILHYAAAVALYVTAGLFSAAKDGHAGRAGLLVAVGWLGMLVGSNWADGDRQLSLVVPLLLGGLALAGLAWRRWGRG